MSFNSLLINHMAISGLIKYFYFMHNIQNIVNWFQ